ncbi:MAG: aminopeptidase P family protein [Phycisphaerales bacterium]|nr:aminopeptidase P family protein [Phycisphaerales bacterium]
MPFSDVQQFMRDRRIDAWLVHDFRASNSVLSRLLPHPEGKRRFTTRRVTLFIPAAGGGRATLLVNPLDAGQFAPPHLDAKWGRELEVKQFIAWRDYHDALAGLIQSAGGTGRVAMEYAPGCTLPVVSVVDAGTVELVRSLGAEVVSSADLIQVSIARWSAAAVADHKIASEKVGAIKDSAFAMIRDALAAGKPISERDVQKHIQSRFTQAGLEFPDGPIVASNAHAGDPHFDVAETGSARITRGDWILIDLWARIPGEHNIFSDITWCGFAGKPGECPPRVLDVFNAVRDARDAALKLAQESWKSGAPAQGWQLDDAARNLLIARGLESAIKHRTGHSLSPGPMVHGAGMNLDNIETRDTRLMLPGIGFTIEPGAYLPSETVGTVKGFGVRNEINVFVDTEKGPVVTSGMQMEPVWCA